MSICQYLWTCIAVFQRYQQLKHFLIEYHYYKRSLCVCMSLFVVQVQMSLLSCQGCGAFFSHKIILMVFGTFKIKGFEGWPCSYSEAIYVRTVNRQIKKVTCFFFFPKNNRITIFSTDNPTEDRNNLKRKKKKQHNDKWLKILHSTNAP